MHSLRKIFNTLILVGSAAALCTTAAFAADTTVNCEGAVSADAVSIMSEADSESEALAELNTDDSVVLLSYDENADWVNVAYDNGEDVINGYLPASDLTLVTKGVVTVLAENAALLDAPSSEGSELKELSRNAAVEVLGSNDDWMLVRSSGEIGYLPYSVTRCQSATTSKLNLRAEPNTDSEILDTLPKGAEFIAIDVEGDWQKVEYEGQTGYICTDYTEASDTYTVEDPTKSDGEAVLEYAQQFLGNRYVWGGTSLTNGCDCSGYVMKIFEEFGVSLPHSSSSIRSYGTKVSLSDIQIGDVVCYSGHVGIYAGDGQIINALNARRGICYINMHYAPIVTVRRML